MERLSPLDASFVHIENAVNHMHIASVAIFEGPPPAYGEVRAMVAGKLPLVPRYRQVVRMVPFELGRPVWLEDPHFRLEYHLRHSALPAPGGPEQLRRLVGRVMSQPLDRGKPLWEMWMIENVGSDRWALVSKLHHAMVDGVSGTDLLTVVLDDSPEPEPPVADRWVPGPPPGVARLVTDAVGERLRSPYEAMRSLRAATRRPRAEARRVLEAGRGLLAMRGLVVPTPSSSLTGPIGPHRRWDWARCSLADVKTVRAGFGGTVNDVVLTIITQGFRELLLSRGESTNRTVRSLVPVSVRSSTERGSYNNRVSAMFAELPVGIKDPVERLASIHSQMEGLKHSKQAVAGDVLTSLSGFAPPLLLALGMRLAARVPGRQLDTVTTNVPGPQHTLYAAGRALVEAYPYVPLAAPVRIGVAIFSYRGALTFGVTADYDTAPDIGVLCRGIEAGLEELLRLAPERREEPAHPRGAPAPA